MFNSNIRTICLQPGIILYIHMYIYIHICISIFPYTLRSGIDVSPAIHLSEIFYSGLYYSSHLIYLYYDNCFLLFAYWLISRYHCIASESGCFCGFLILHEETFHLTFVLFFLCWHYEYSLLPLFLSHTHTRTHTHTHTHTQTTHTHTTAPAAFFSICEPVKVV